jgi:hypothetical protein
MKPLSRDTTTIAQRKHFELMRRLTPTQRLTMACSLTEAGRKLIFADLRHRFPKADETEIRRRFIARVLSREDVIRAYGFDPRSESF